jgi:hypothetical protein
MASLRAASSGNAACRVRWHRSRSPDSVSVFAASNRSCSDWGDTAAAALISPAWEAESCPERNASSTCGSFVTRLAVSIASDALRTDVPVWAAIQCAADR